MRLALQSPHGCGDHEKRGGDYCLARSANQDAALSDARSCFGKLSPDHPVARREGAGHGRKETRYFALSWTPAPEAFMTTVRAHWAIENALHWQLDVSFREDAARNRNDNGPANIAILRRRAAGVACRDTSKGSLSIKLKQAGWSDAFLLSLLNQLGGA